MPRVPALTSCVVPQMENGPGSSTDSAAEWAEAGRTLPGLAALFGKYAKVATERGRVYAKAIGGVMAKIDAREASLRELQHAVAREKRAPRREAGAVKQQAEHVLRAFRYPTTLAGAVFASPRNLVDEYSTVRGPYTQYVESLIALCNCFDFVTQRYESLTSAEGGVLPIDTKAWFIRMFAEQCPRGALPVLNARIDAINVSPLPPPHHATTGGWALR